MTGDATGRASGANARGSARPVRLLTLTALFPNAAQPRLGVFVANRVRKLCDTGRVTASVVAPVPWFFGAYARNRATPRTERILGLEVAHPRYLNVPRLGMRLQPDLLAHALLRHVRRTGADRTRFDVVEAHYFYPDGVAAHAVARALDLPLVISARGSDINLIGALAFAKRRMLKAANAASALIAVSGALAERMAALGMPRERIHVLRNGVDTELFRPVDRQEARARLGLAEGRWVLGVGNLVPEKRFNLLVSAVAALPDVRLLLVGEGVLRKGLASLARDIAPGRVEFRDNLPQSELRYAYAACDVLGLPSLREGWPNVVLEAIACGTPVAAAAVGGVPEILGPDAPGVLVNVARAQEWQAALRTLLDARMAPDAVRAYALRFGWDDVVSRQCDVYEAVVAAWARLRQEREMTAQPV